MDYWSLLTFVHPVATAASKMYVVAQLGVNHFTGDCDALRLGAECQRRTYNPLARRRAEPDSGTAT
jgi:hypothetical protein